MPSSFHKPPKSNRMSIIRYLANLFTGGGSSDSAATESPENHSDPSPENHPASSEPEPAIEVRGTEKLLLYLTATNFDHVIDDTQQLSVRRGTSIFLRELTHRELPSWLAELKLSYKAISTGASTGLYEICDANRRGFEKELKEWLNTLPRRYFTFSYAIATAEEPENFSQQVRSLQNEVNLARQQGLSLSLAGLCDEGTGENGKDGVPFACQWDGVRPAKSGSLTRKENNEDQSYHLSPSVVSRYFSGRTYQGKDGSKEVDVQTIKQAFIKTETDNEIDEFFTYDLEQLGSFPTHAKPFSNFSNLNNKMAVIYIDGNGFGARRKALATSEDYKNFDDAILDARKTFLTDLFDTWKNREAFLNRHIDTTKDRQNKPHCRFELLQWGGDELLFIVPAWLGFPILQQFFQTPFTWDEKPLTHAAGMALCSIKTPISRAQALAIELAEWCKDTSRRENLYAALVLESIDYPTQPLKTFFEQRFHGLADYHLPHRPYPGSLSDWSKQLDLIDALKNGLPRARVIECLLDLLETLGEGKSCHADSEHERCFAETAKRLQGIVEEYGLTDKLQAWQALFPYFDENWLATTNLEPKDVNKIKHAFPQAQKVWQWLYLVEYWDYLLTDEALGIERQEEKNGQ